MREKLLLLSLHLQQKWYGKSVHLCSLHQACENEKNWPNCDEGIESYVSRGLVIFEK